MLGLESRAKDILREWDRAVEIYQDLQDDVEQAILKYEEIQRLYDSSCYDLREAEERINELEEVSRSLQFHKCDAAIGHQYNSVGNTGKAGTDKLQCQTVSIPDCLSQRLLHLLFNHGLELLCISEYRLMCDGR